jgi:hypothetical protein
MTHHWSSCAVHNEPALPAGPCNCGGVPFRIWWAAKLRRLWISWWKPGISTYLKQTKFRCR